MRKFGKTIKLFLIDREPNGQLTCEFSNWTGKAYKIPRIKIKDCTDRPDLTNPGVYLLFGKNETGKDLVYIGEAETVLKRLTQHLTQKDFWTEDHVFSSPSTAAVMVLGRNANGLTEWKLKDGTTLKDFEIVKK